ARTVSAHLNAVLDLLGPLPPLDVVLTDASVCIVAEDVTATADLPRADLAAYDGYAVRSRDVAGASTQKPVTLRVLADAAPGHATAGHVVAHSRVRVPSGALLPADADAVVPAPDTDAGTASVQIRAEAEPAAGVRTAGEDVRSGELALASG